MARFDEIELIKEPTTTSAPPLRPLPPLETALPDPLSHPRPAAPANDSPAPHLKRILALLTDLSLLVALALALTPLLPQRGSLADTLADGWLPIAALAGFLLLLSWYYAVGSWIIWGRTVGGTIFDTRIVDLDGSSPSVGSATRRWLWTGVSILLGGLPFLIGAFGERRTLGERLSGTKTVGA
jgi:uncharacterized RDD family membrane protein YckC